MVITQVSCARQETPPF